MKRIHAYFSQNFLLMLLALGLGAFGCKDPEPDPLDYDRERMLQSIGENYILPAYERFDEKATAFNDNAVTFAANPTLSGLYQLVTDLWNTRVAFVQCSQFEFGPATAISLRSTVNTWPVDPSQIETNISSGSWDLAQAANVDARGLPALDYLIHHADVQTVLDEFSTGSNATDRLRMLTDLTADVAASARHVYTGWAPANDNYLSAFTGNLGTDAGSSTAFLVNQLNFDLEILKNARIGIPLGKKSLDVPFPEKVESRYGASSKALAESHLAAVQAVFEGTDYTSQADRYGLYEALEALEADYNGQPLAGALRNQFDLAATAIAALPDSLQDAVINDRAPVEAAYTELAKLVVLLKTDLPSAMGILITYTDNDGD